MSQIGYARAGSAGQTLDAQLKKLEGCGKIFKEQDSIATNPMPMLKDCLRYLKEGDTLVITRLDRLALSTLQLCKIARELQRKEVFIKVIDQNNSKDNVLFNMLGLIYQFETEVRAEKKMNALRRVLSKENNFNKKQKLSAEQILLLKEKRQQGAKIKDLMAEYDLSKSSIYS